MLTLTRRNAAPRSQNASGLIAIGGLGGAATPTEPIYAIVYGLGWQSTIGGLLNAKPSSAQPGNHTSAALPQDSAFGS